MKFKTPFLTAHTTYSSTNFKRLILKGERIVAFCENHWVRNKFYTRNEKFLYIEESGCRSFPWNVSSNYTTFKLRQSVINEYSE